MDLQRVAGLGTLDENGPVCGLTLVRSSFAETVLSETEKTSLDASRVVVITESPELIRMAGGWEWQ